MRMRLKKWARPELEACLFYIRQPEEYRGRWAEAFRREAPLELELGCGKGVSTALMALENPGVNLVAVDINSSVLGVAKRNAEAAFAGRRAVDNLKLMNYEIELISRVFAPEDAVRRIYISFPNPWTQRHRQEKHRLTHTRLLNIYRGFMADGGEIWFKTDNDELFEASLSYFPQAGFEIKELTRDLHAEASHPNYISEHEKLFSSQGIPIKALIAVKR
jgi:Predicted S-adenosylmethionine-dependent methyltransferase